MHIINCAWVNMNNLEWYYSLYLANHNANDYVFAIVADMKYTSTLNSAVEIPAPNCVVAVTKNDQPECAASSFWSSNV